MGGIGRVCTCVSFYHDQILASDGIWNKMKLYVSGKVCTYLNSTDKHTIRYIRINFCLKKKKLLKLKRRKKNRCHNINNSTSIFIFLYIINVKKM